jgi:hypothetical protein
MDADNNEQYRFEPRHTTTTKGLRRYRAHFCSSDFRETVIAHVLMVVRWLIDVLLVIRHTTVVQHGGWVWQCTFVRLLVLNVRRRRRECTFVLLRVDRERVLVAIVTLGAIVIDRTGWHRVELIIGNGRAAFNRDAVEFVQLLFASCGGEAVADFA